MVEMKKVWSRPLTVVQNFEANEYVAACGDTEYGVYKFECDAPEGTLYYYDNSGNAHYVGFTYHPCGETHEASVRSEFPEGFVDRNHNFSEDPGEHVIVWIERWPNGFIRNGHATTHVDRDSWEVSKS